MQVKEANQKKEILKPGVKSRLKIFGHSVAILFTLALFLALIFGILKSIYSDTHILHCEYEGQSYTLHINEGWRSTIIDMQYGDVLISKVVSNKYAKENGFYKKFDSDYPILKQQRRDYKKIILYMLSESERSVVNGN